jgi:hypothetical protein
MTSAPSATRSPRMLPHAAGSAGGIALVQKSPMASRSALYAGQTRKGRLRPEDVPARQVKAIVRSHCVLLPRRILWCVMTYRRRSTT